MTDIDGHMGYWIDPSASHERTVAVDEARLDYLGEVSPELVTARPAKDADPTTLTMLKKLQEVDEIEDGIDLRYIEKLTFGDFIPWKAQRIGSCVASGCMRALTKRIYVELLILGDVEEKLGRDFTGTDNVAPFAPYSYRAGRKIGGLNRGDGSFCSAHISGLQEYGFLPCSTPGLKSDEFPEPQSSAAYRKWGNSDSLLSEYSSAGRKFDLLESERIKSADRGRVALVEEYKPFMICSNWAFKSDKKHATWNSDGRLVTIYTRNRRGSWAHNMTICGFVKIGRNEYTIVENSWGKTAHSGRSWFPIPVNLFDEWVRSSGTVCMSIGDLDLKDTEKFAL